VSRRSTPVESAVTPAGFADTPLIPLPTLARAEAATKGVVAAACRALGITPKRTATGRDHLSINQAIRIVDHIRRQAAS